MSPVRQAAHWICSVLIFKANHWEFGSPMLLRHTHVASWQVIFEKPSKCTSVQIFKCSLFSSFFQKPFTFANKKTRAVCRANLGKNAASASAVPDFLVKLNWSAEVAEREEPGEPGSSLPGRQLEIVCTRWPLRSLQMKLQKRPPYKWAKWKWVIGVFPPL